MVILKDKNQLIIDEPDWKSLAQDYNLSESVNEARLRALWLELKKYSQPVISYELSDNKSFINAAVTLGKEAGDLERSKEENERLLDAYIIDCLGLEMLRSLYKKIEEDLRLQGLFIEEYIFYNPENYRKDDISSTLKRLKVDNIIRVSEAGMLSPLKSVVYQAHLTESPQNKCENICDSCGKTDCANRHFGNRNSESKENKTGALKYSYGYQKIFGK